MKFPGAPWGLKMACGENPKRVYGSKGGPSTRMGNVAGYRAAFIDASRIHEEEPRKDAAGIAEEALVAERFGHHRQRQRQRRKRDLKLDTLAGAINGDILVNIHCYRADEMAVMLDLAKEFGFRISAFHHGVEAYKIADRLAAGRRLRRALGRLVGLQDGSLRRHPGEHRPGRPRRRTAARSCIRIPRKASSDSTRKRRR
jgi:imidazolonepropionase-like amidohydrolase